MSAKTTMQISIAHPVLTEENASTVMFGLLHSFIGAAKAFPASPFDADLGREAIALLPHDQLPNANLRKSVEAVVIMLKNGEYTEHWAICNGGDPLAQELEDCLTQLVSDTISPADVGLRAAIEIAQNIRDTTDTGMAALYAETERAMMEGCCDRVISKLEDALGAEAQPAAPACANLEGVREQLLTPRATVRDQDGWLSHSAMPVCDEGTRLDKLLEAFSIEPVFVSMESDDSVFYDKWHDEGLCDCTPWEPTCPDGHGWLLLEIYDTEDGPVALYGRDWYEAEKARRAENRARVRTENFRAAQEALVAPEKGIES